jgi:hypothetical protein
MKLAYLADHPEFCPLVAQWNWDEWHTLLVERSAAEFEAWLRANVRWYAIPTTLLAFEGVAVVGTVSVVDYDLELSNDLSPWLASLYVAPLHRGKGQGGRSCRPRSTKRPGSAFVRSISTRRDRRRSIRHSAGSAWSRSVIATGRSRSCAEAWVSRVLRLRPSRIARSAR